MQAVLCWFACASTGPMLSNTAPLAFGMSQESAAHALGVPLVPVGKARRSGVYVAERRAAVVWYPVDRRIYLQFRNGRLTGWKNDWHMRPPWF